MSKRTCSIDGCDGAHKGRGFCNMHLKRLKKHGSPHVGGPPETPAYRTIHNRLHAQRGKASEHSCVDCGKAAKHWSYSGNAANEFAYRDSRGFDLTYTDDLSHYDPRCIPCHLGYDRPKPAFCPQGHPYTEENTWVKAEGVRVCRACKSSKYRAWKARKRAERGLPAGRITRSGEESPTAKLTWGDVRRIRSLKAAGSTYPMLEEEFGVSKATLHRVVAGISWKEGSDV